MTWASFSVNAMCETIWRGAKLINRKELLQFKIRDNSAECCKESDPKQREILQYLARWGCMSVYLWANHIQGYSRLL